MSRRLIFPLSVKCKLSGFASEMSFSNSCVLYLNCKTADYVITTWSLMFVLICMYEYTIHCFTQISRLFDTCFFLLSLSS